MVRRCEILGAGRGESLILGSGRGYDYSWTVEVHAEGLDASASVATGGGEPAMVELFEGMARDWRGWTGARSWKSIEGNFAVSCTHDRLGHVPMVVRLTPGGYEPAWTIECTIHLEAGGLERVARMLRGFVPGG